MEHSPDISTCPFGMSGDNAISLSKNKKYWEHVAKINSKTPAANLYSVDDDAPWFWPDENLAEIVVIRKQRFSDEPDRILNTGDNDPAIRAAAAELLKEQSYFLATHFPDDYTIDIDGDGNETIVNRTSGDAYPIQPDESDLHPLAISGLLGQEDICLVQHMNDGREVLVAGFLATPTGWDLADFVGRDMDGIHREVDGYHQPLYDNKPLKDTVDKVFLRLRSRRQLKLARNNILLYQTPLQALVPGQAPDLNQEDVTEPGNQIYLRSEYETLTAIDDEFAVFTIAPKVIPLSELASTARLPELRKLLENKTITGGKKVLARKALEYLDSK